MKENYSAQSKTSNEVNSQDTWFQSNNSKRPKSLIIILAIVLALLIGGAGGYVLRLANNFQKEIQPTQKSKTLPTPSVVPSVTQLRGKVRLLMEKEIEGGRIVAYRLNDDLSEDLNAGVFAVELETGEYHPVIFSVSSPAYFEDSLFEIIGHELWIVNGQTNKIDVYGYQPEKKEGDVIQMSSLIYKDSIDLPKYRVGVIYSIKCDKENCVVSTAHHQESGCTMDLRLKTRQYSNIKCSHMGGEFTPEPF